MSIEVRELTTEEYPLWDELVAQSEQGSLYHQSGWIRLVREYSGGESVILGAFEGENLLGGCSLYTRTIYGAIRYATSIAPMTPYGGVCVSPAKNRQKGESMRYLHKICTPIARYLGNRYSAIELINTPELVDIRPFTWNEWRSSVMFTSRLNLQQDIPGNSSREVRRALRSAEESGITVEIKRDIHRHYRLLQMTFERQNLVPPISEQSMTALMRFIFSRGLGEMWIAVTPEGEDASSGIVLWDQRRAHGWSVATDPRFRDTHAQSLMQLASFTYLRERGFEAIDLKAANMPAIAEYYARYNPALVPYYRLHKVSRRLGGVLALKEWLNQFRTRGPDDPGMA